MKKRCICLMILFLCGGCTKNPSQEITLHVGTFRLQSISKEVSEQQFQLIKEAGIELVALQAVDRNTERLPHDSVKIMKKTPFIDGFFSASMKYSGGEYGLMTLSQYFITQETDGKIYSDASSNQKKLQEYLTLTANFTSKNKALIARRTQLVQEGVIEPRIYQHCFIEKEGKTVSFYNVHLSHENKSLRERQLKDIKKMLDEDTCIYKVIAGTFNNDQSTDELYMFKDDYKIANGQYGKWMETYPIRDDENMRIYSIDNIICSKNIHIDTVSMIPSNVADHNLFSAQLILR